VPPTKDDDDAADEDAAANEDAAADEDGTANEDAAKQSATATQFNAVMNAVQAAVDAANTAVFGSTIDNAIAIIDADDDDFVLISALKEQFERKRDAAAARS
jgi:hypothetical protein